MRAVVGVVAILAGLTIPAVAAPIARTGSVVRVEHRAPTALPTRGPLTAPVTIELFFTPGAGSRQTAFHNVEKLQAAHPTQIRLVYRIVKGGGNARLHYAVLEAYAEGKFDELMDALNRSRVPTYTDQALLELGKSAGVDPQRLAIVISNPPIAYDRVLDINQHRLKQRVRTGTTPSVLFNGRPTQTQLVAMSAQDLDREYANTKDSAEDQIDRGIDPRELADELLEPPTPASKIVVTPGPTDDVVDDLPAVPPLAAPPLDLSGMPSLGRADAPVTIAVLCNPTSQNCATAMRTARIVQDVYSESIRIVWAPFFDVTHDEAPAWSLLSDAALCAEQVGTSAEIDFDSTSSAGWRWVETVLIEASNQHRRHGASDQLLDKVADKLHVDTAAFAACRARMAGTAVAWIEDARRAGVRTSPSTVIDGRVYPAIIDQNILRLLVESELAPGWLREAAPSGRRTTPAR